MDRTSIRRLIRDNRALFPLVYEFNCRPARYIHPGHLAEWIQPGLLQRLRTSPRGEHRLSEWISARWDLHDSGVWDFDQTPRRLALLDYATLDRLMTLTGAAVYHRRISLVVDRETQGRLKESLGDAYLFAVKRAPFLVKELPEGLADHIGDDPVAQLREAGRMCLSSCLAGAPPELFQRLALKLPPGTTIDRDTPLSELERNSVWNTLKRILLSEVNPGVAPCFN